MSEREPLVCRDCGTALERRTGRQGRQRERCEPCRAARYSAAYWRERKRAQRELDRARERGPHPCPCGCGKTLQAGERLCPETHEELVRWDAEASAERLREAVANKVRALRAEETRQASERCPCGCGLALNNAEGRCPESAQAEGEARGER